MTVGPRQSMTLMSPLSPTVHCTHKRTSLSVGWRLNGCGQAAVFNQMATTRAAQSTQAPASRCQSPVGASAISIVPVKRYRARHGRHGRHVHRLHRCPSRKLQARSEQRKGNQGVSQHSSCALHRLTTSIAAFRKWAGLKLASGVGAHRPHLAAQGNYLSRSTPYQAPPPPPPPRHSPPSTTPIRNSLSSCSILLVDP